MGLQDFKGFLLKAYLLIVIVFSPAISSGETPTAYQVLEGYDFPVGILPKGVTGYDLNSSSGKFSAYMSGSCSFSIEGSYQLRYKSTINGRISKGRLTDLVGVSVKLLFIWVDIIEVYRSGNDLQFSVGIASAGFPIENFLECPQCGCGLNCNGREKMKVSTTPFTSSR